MPFFSSTATIKTVDNTVANFATNRWHFEADDLTALALAHAALVTFYQAVDTYFSNLVLGLNGLEITAYNDLDPTPRPPVLTTVATIVPSAGVPLPPEVSLCLSFQGTRLAGTPQAQRRGRVYLPFFGETGNDTDGRPTPAMVTALAAAGGALLTASTAAATWAWLTYSTVAPGYTQVVNGWVDNEWDTQRRRGRAATSRTTF